jgi:hypothetical protein
MPDTTLEGGCLCGHIRYRASGLPYAVNHCHCEQCRRYTGAVYATGVAYSAENVSWLNAEPTIYMATDTSISGRSFCSKCGSSIADHSFDDNDVWLYIGTFDNPGSVTPRNHIFVEEKISWVKIDDGLAQYPKMDPE